MKSNMKRLSLMMCLLGMMLAGTGLRTQNVPVTLVTGWTLEKKLNSERNCNTDLSCYTYVDLGLPSGTLWATCNVGADKPDGSGDYFAWGEINPKTTYSWNTYQYAKGSWNELTKYCSKAIDGYDNYTDKLTTLQLSDDVAAVRLGDGWCIPTEEQWLELFQNTHSEWVKTDYAIGMLFTASNDVWLFLPFAGRRRDNDVKGDGSNGFYWSSSLYTDNPHYAYNFFLNSGNWTKQYVSRCHGLSIRPVRSAK